MKKEEMKKLDVKVLQEEAKRLRKELFDLKLNFEAGEVKDYSRFKKMRADMSRYQTFLSQKKKELGVIKV